MFNKSIVIVDGDPELKLGTFKITIEYHGIPKSDKEARLKFERAFLMTRTEYFVKWLMMYLIQVL
jgi:hypothetical protein